MKKTVLITGAASGIGKQTALFFAQKDWNVIATMLSLAEADDLLQYPTISCYELDVTSTESIRLAQQKIALDHKKIDLGTTGQLEDFLTGDKLSIRKKPGTDFLCIVGRIFF